MSDTYHWGAEASGLEIGLRLSASAIRAGEAVNIQLAVRNRSQHALGVSPRFALLVRRGDTVEEYGSGPRSSKDMMIDAGETLELLSWRLTEEQLGPPPGTCLISAAYRPHERDELRSAEARVEMIA